MNRLVILISCLILGTEAFAQQVGIGTNSVHPSAILEVKPNTNKGILLPRVELTSSTDIVTIPNPVLGLLVYNVGSNMINGPYYWSGSKWQTISSMGLPDFTITFDMDSQAGTNSFKEVVTGLPEIPGRIRVLLTPRDITDNNYGYNFQAFGSQPKDDDTGSYGGLIFAYDDTRIWLWAPDQNDGNNEGRIINLVDGWGGEVNTSSTNEATVTILLWKKWFN